MSQQRPTDVEQAIAAFQAGEPVLIHDDDDREAETDLIYPGGAVTPEAVSRLRNDAGGLICVALADDVAEAFDLPFLTDAIDHPATEAPVAYDERSSFSLTVNHRDTYTGITDRDRALTITALAEAATDPEGTDFTTEFRSPGHVHLLRGAPDGLADRQGHTELGLALAAAAGREPAVVVCEMLDDETGGARSKVAARDYATRHDLVFIEGTDLLAALR